MLNFADAAAAASAKKETAPAGRRKGAAILPYLQLNIAQFIPIQAVFLHMQNSEPQVAARPFTILFLLI